MQVKVGLPDDVAGRVDVVRGDVSRSMWIRRAVELRLGDVSAATAVDALEAASHAVTRAQAVGAAESMEVRVEAGSMLRDGGAAAHREGCKCLNCERARGNVA
jgi:hypothetical protein